MVARLLFLSFFLTAWPSGAFAALKCTVDRISERTAVVAIAERHVPIFGWPHLADNEMAFLVSKFNDAENAAKANDCATAKSSIEGALKTLDNDVNYLDHMINMLDAAKKDYGLDAIGVEFTAQDLKVNQDSLARFEVRAKAIASSCPDVSDALEGFMQLAQGPELTYAKKHQRLDMILPLEDQKAKYDNEQSAMKPLPFNDRDPRITGQSVDALKEFFKAVYAQKNPSEQILDESVSFATDPAERQELKSQLRESIPVLQEQMAGVFVRNAWIAKNILKAQGNIAVILGYNHVDDLLKQLVEQCESNP